MSEYVTYADRPKKLDETYDLPPNPKKLYGDRKVNLALVPSSALIHMALAFTQGAEKYGPYNWRQDPVEAITYVAACERHLRAWLDGENFDPDSGFSHLGHAGACLAILIDAGETQTLIDNRPRRSPIGALLRLSEKAVREISNATE